MGEERVRRRLPAILAADVVGYDHQFSHIMLAARYVGLGRDDDAKAEVAAILEGDPEYLLETFRKGRSYRNLEDLAHVQSAPAQGRRAAEGW